MTPHNTSSNAHSKPNTTSTQGTETALPKEADFRADNQNINIMERRANFGLPARSYEIIVETDLSSAEVTQAIHTWAIQNGYEFGGALSENARGMVVFGEFPPNKFSQEVDTSEITKALTLHLRGVQGVRAATDVPVVREMTSNELCGVVGVKPGYGNEVPFDLQVAQNVAVQCGTVKEFRPATIFYNYRDSKMSDGYARCDEPGVFVSICRHTNVSADDVASAFSTALKQTSVHFVLGSQDPSKPEHHAWKKVGEKTARELADNV